MNARRRPRIGVSVSARTGWRVFPFFWLAVFRAGGIAVRIQTTRKRRNLAGLDGLIVGGGDDIGVELYGGRIVAGAKVDRERDALESALIREAEAAGLPILGVCRGAQLINVIRGGSLHGDIYEVYPNARRISTPLPRKTIRIRPGSRLAGIKGTEESRINALHRQSVNRLGARLLDCAWDEAGIIQAVESVDERFVLGVQWHPEYLVASRRDQRLFRAIVAAARRGPISAAPAPSEHPADAGEASVSPA